MKSKFKYAMLAFCLLFAIHLGAANRAEADSSKSKYALNDPRNPDCPCHKYQALADKEYARLLQKSGQDGKPAAQRESLIKGKKPGKLHSRKWRRNEGRNHVKEVRKKKCFGDRLSRCFHF